jgi:hypothetical protein
LRCRVLRLVADDWQKKDRSLMKFAITCRLGRDDYASEIFQDGFSSSPSATESFACGMFTRNLSREASLYRRRAVFADALPLEQEEDIINRGGGTCAHPVYNSTPDEQLADTEVTLLRWTHIYRSRRTQIR